MARKPIIGITGGIGSGKSLVAEILHALGAAVIDSDAMVHEQYRDPEVISTLVSWWGARVCPDGQAVDRHAIADIVFEQPDELRRLEGLLYPRIEQQRRARMAELAGDPAVKAIVLDTPKLMDVGLDRECDAIIFVAAEPEARAARVQARRGWSAEELARRESLQMPLDRKRTRADYIVENNTSVDELQTDVERIFRSVLAGQSL